MRRGEIWLADLDPASGREANKSRPCVVVSRDASNIVVDRTGVGVITVVPLTSNVARVLPFQHLVPGSGTTGLHAPSKAQAEQIRSLDVSRFVRRLGAVDAETLAGIDEALLLHLDLL